MSDDLEILSSIISGYHMVKIYKYIYKKMPTKS